MVSPDRGNLLFSGDGYAIQLQLFDPTFIINENGVQIQLPAEIRREDQINRVGKRFEPTLDTLTTRAETVSKHVRILTQLHGDLLDDNFRFIADKL